MSSSTREVRSRASAFREQQAKRTRRRRAGVIAIVVVAVLLVAAIVVVIATSLGASSTPPAAAATGTTGPEGIVLQQGTALAGDTTSKTGTAVDGVQCGSSEQTATHIHTHLQVYVNGAPRSIPAGIGIVEPVQDTGTTQTFYGASECYYWLHVHAADGVIHVEAPAGKTFTLGQFFAVWGQPLSSTDVAGAEGAQTVYVNGSKVTGDPSSIVLKSREDVQIDVGRDVQYRKIDWSKSQL